MGHPVPLPEPRGQRLLIIVRAQRARRRGGRPSPSAPLVDANPAPPPPTHSPASESREGGRGSAAPHAGPCAPAQVGGRGLVGACPTRSGLEEARLDLRRRRHLAAYSENTPSHPNLGGSLPDSPALCPLPLEPRPPPSAALCSPTFPPSHLLREKSLIERQPLNPQKSLG